jgi:hypothetical protein
MATQQGLLSAQVTDTYGITATTEAFITIDDTKTVAQLLADAGGWALLVQELSQGSVKKFSVTVEAPLLEAVTAAGDVEKGGLFNFNNATDPYAQGYWIPDISPAVLNSQGLIDLSNSNVEAFITFMTTAHTAITIVTKGVRALTALRDALISFRKHRKPLSRRTKEV